MRFTKKQVSDAYQAGRHKERKVRLFQAFIVIVLAFAAGVGGTLAYQKVDGLCAAWFKGEPR